MNNDLMVLGSNEPLIKRACELGFNVHSYGLKPPKCLQFAGRKVIFHKQNILDYDSLLVACEKLKPCGVVSVCSELAMHPMHFLLRKLGIACNSSWTEQTTTNKYLMRKAMSEAGLDTPKYTLVTNKMGFNEIENSIIDFKFPLIIKPVDLSASRGVMKINSINDLQKAVDYSLGWSKKKECILEEFIDGPEYSGESIAFKGNYNLLAITEKETTGAPHFVEIAHRQPALLSLEMKNRIKDTLFKAFKALRIEYGAIHPEFRITAEGRILFMEIATRMGGDHIGTELTPLSSGYDFLGMVIDICCGNEPNLRLLHEPMFAEVHYILSQEDMDEIKKLKNDSNINLVYLSEIGEFSNEVNKSADRAGYYIFTKQFK